MKNALVAELTARSLAAFGRAKSRMIGILLDDVGDYEVWYSIVGLDALVLTRY